MERFQGPRLPLPRTHEHRWVHTAPLEVRLTSAHTRTIVEGTSRRGRGPVEGAGVLQWGRGWDV